MIVKKYLEFILGILLMGQLSFAEPPAKFPELFAKKQISWSVPHRKTVLVFVSYICPCFRNGIETIKNQAKTYHDSYYFIGVVGKKDSKKKVQKFYEKIDLGIPIIVDKQNLLAKKYQVETVSTAVVLETPDKVLYRGGIINEDSNPLLATALEDIKISGQTKVPFDKGVGCTVE